MMHSFKVHWTAQTDGGQRKGATYVTAVTPQLARQQMTQALQTEGYRHPIIRKVKRAPDGE